MTTYRLPIAIEHALPNWALVEEGSEATHFMDIKGLAKQKKIRISPSM